ARAGDDVVVDRLLEPHVDVEQAAAAAGRGVPALERQPGVGGGKEGDVLDGVFDVEVFEGRDVEVRRVEVSLDEPGQDGAAAGVDLGVVRRHLGQAGGRAGVGDAAVADEQRAVADGGRAGAVDQRAVADQQRPVRGLHQRGPRVVGGEWSRA